MYLIVLSIFVVSMLDTSSVSTLRWFVPNEHVRTGETYQAWLQVTPRKFPLEVILKPIVGVQIWSDTSCSKPIYRLNFTVVEDTLMSICYEIQQNGALRDAMGIRLVAAAAVRNDTSYESIVMSRPIMIQAGRKLGPLWTAIITALAGVVVGGLMALLQTLITNKTERNRYLSNLRMKMHDELKPEVAQNLNILTRLEKQDNPQQLNIKQINVLLGMLSANDVKDLDWPFKEYADQCNKYNRVYRKWERLNKTQNSKKNKKLKEMKDIGGEIMKLSECKALYKS